MLDRYMEFSHSQFGQLIADNLGLPKPPKLARARTPWTDQPLEGKSALITATRDAVFANELLQALHDSGATVRVRTEHAGLAPIKKAAADLKVPLTGEPAPGEGVPAHVLAIDASGVNSADDLRQLYDFFKPQLRRLPNNSRIIVLGQEPGSIADKPLASTAAAALSGFVRSLAKESGKNGTTANLIYATTQAKAGIEGAVRFFVSEHSAFITGQVLNVTNKAKKPTSYAGMLEGKTAVVTGAARGIGASIAQVLAREGAHVIGVDRPQEEGPLADTLSGIGGSGLALDVTAADTPEKLAKALEAAGGADIVIHNAGITRDKMLRNMSEQWWDMVLDVNLGAILRINERLMKSGLNDGARMVCISSIGGIAGNAGQTNYGATKSGVIGYCAAMAKTFASLGGGINAVAPGFIETQMTAAMPVVPREVGRRINSLSQGGVPQDIAETVAYMASPAASGVNGQVLRVCGQNWFGA